MEKNNAFGSLNNTLLLQTQNLDCSSQVLDSFWNSGFSPPFKGDPVSGSASMVNFHNPPQETRGSEGYIASLDIDENNGEFYDPCCHQPEKKRRLTKDQVQFLEKSFEVENKLEQERKVQLAKDTGLQPRQVSIWYQNRRARYRTKQLEKDYDSMKESYKRLKVDYDKLFKENENLRNEVEFLKETIFVGEKMKTGFEPYDPMNSLDVEATRQKQSGDIILGKASDPQVMVCKQEDTNNSDKLHCGEGNLKSISESIDSSSILETEHSDFSQDDEDTFRRIMLPPNPMKLDNLYLDNHYNLESSAEDEPFLLWTDQLYL